MFVCVTLFKIIKKLSRKSLLPIDVKQLPHESVCTFDYAVNVFCVNFNL